MTEILEVGSEFFSDSRSKSQTELDIVDEFQSSSQVVEAQARGNARRQDNFQQ